MLWIIVPLLGLLIVIGFLILGEIKNIKKIREHNKMVLTREAVVSHRDFERLDIEEILEPDYRIPRGQWLHFRFKVVNLSEAQKVRKYTGTNTSGLKIPLVDLSFQNKEFHDTTNFANRGPAVVNLTNAILRVETDDSDQSLLRTWNWSSIERVKFVSDNRTIQVTTNRNAWPLRFQFEDHETALKFANAIWTLVDEYTSIKLHEVGDKPEGSIEIAQTLKARKYELSYVNENGTIFQDIVTLDDIKDKIKFHKLYKITELNKMTRPALIKLMFCDLEVRDIKPIKKSELISLILESQYIDIKDSEMEDSKDEGDENEIV